MASSGLRQLLFNFSLAPSNRLKSILTDHGTIPEPLLLHHLTHFVKRCAVSCVLHGPRTTAPGTQLEKKSRFQTRNKHACGSVLDPATANTRHSARCTLTHPSQHARAQKQPAARLACTPRHHTEFQELQSSRTLHRNRFGLVYFTAHA